MRTSPAVNDNPFSSNLHTTNTMTLPIAKSTVLNLIDRRMISVAQMDQVVPWYGSHVGEYFKLSTWNIIPFKVTYERAGWKMQLIKETNGEFEAADNGDLVMRIFLSL